MAHKQISDHHQRFEYLSTYLRQYRINENLTQKDLSQTIHRNTIIRAENSKNITLLSLFELADALNLSLREIFLDID